VTIKKLLKDPKIRLRTIEKTAKIAQAITMLAADDTSALLVTHDKRTIDGILSASDIVRHLKRHRTVSDDLFVEDLMTKRVITCDVKETVQRLEVLMTQNNVRHIPITDAGALVAVVSIIDVTRHRLSLAEGEMSQMRDFVSGAA
jgi:CBS domain-containing protein